MTKLLPEIIGQFGFTVGMSQREKAGNTHWPPPQALGRIILRYWMHTKLEVDEPPGSSL